MNGILGKEHSTQDRYKNSSVIVLFACGRMNVLLGRMFILLIHQRRVDKCCVNINVLERQIFHCLPDHLEGPDRQPRDIAEDEDNHDDATDPRQPVLHGAPLKWSWTNR